MSKSVSKSTKKSEAVAEVAKAVEVVAEVKTEKKSKKATKEEVVAPAPAVVESAPVKEKKSKKAAKEVAPEAVEVAAEDTDATPAARSRRLVTPESVSEDFAKLHEALKSVLAEVSEKKIPSSRTIKRIIKAASVLESDVVKVSKTKKRTHRAANANSGFMKPVKISKDLAKFTGWAPDQLRSRNDVTKFICSYIKDNNLQNPENRRHIVPDPKLAKLLAFDGKKDENLTYPLLQRYMQPHFQTTTA